MIDKRTDVPNLVRKLLFHLDGDGDWKKMRMCLGVGHLDDEVDDGDGEDGGDGGGGHLVQLKQFKMMMVTVERSLFTDAFR